MTSNYGGSAPDRIAQTARGWEGRDFKKSQNRRGADLAKYGRQVKSPQKGDLVLFRDTYRKGKYAHVGIALGNGQFAHRVTSAGGPVTVNDMSKGSWANPLSEIRRLHWAPTGPAIRD